MNTAAIDHLVQAAQQLSEAEQRVLLQKLQAAIGKDTPEREKGDRQEGLHAGMGWIADDFDEPLPDAFWGFDKPL